MKSLAFVGDTFEQSVLGALMIDNSALQRVEFLTPSMFTGKHAEIFAAMLDRESRNEPFDPVSLADVVSSLNYLGELCRNTLSTANVVHYARRVQDNALRRKIISECGEIISLADNTETDDLIDIAQARVLALSPEQTSEAGDITQCLAESVDRLDMLSNSDGTITGVPTGFTDLDARYFGLQRSDLIIVAGRPSMGKTTLAMNIAVTAAAVAPVLVFSLEMSRSQLADRMICAAGSIAFQDYRSGKVRDEDWPRVTHAVSRISKLPITIDDAGGLSIMQIRARARKAHRKARDGLGLIVVDYLQLVTAPGRDRFQEVSEISRQLKALAKELNVPVMALSQLSRECEKRPSKRPVLADLRESGSIEQDADIVAMVYRDEVYDPESPDRGTAEIITRKYRNGQIGTDRLVFIGEYLRFENYTHRDRWAGPDE